MSSGSRHLSSPGRKTTPAMDCDIMRNPLPVNTHKRTQILSLLSRCITKHTHNTYCTITPIQHPPSFLLSPPTPSPPFPKKAPRPLRRSPSINKAHIIFQKHTKKEKRNRLNKSGQQIQPLNIKNTHLINNPPPRHWQP